MAQEEKNYTYLIVDMYEDKANKRHWFVPFKSVKDVKLAYKRMNEHIAKVMHTKYYDSTILKQVEHEE